MRNRNRYMFVVFSIVCVPLFLTGCPVPSGIVGNLCSAAAAAGGSPAPGLCPAAGQSANPDFLIIPSPGSSGSIVIIGGNGPSSPGAAGQFTLQNPQILPPISVAVGSSVDVLCADGTSPTGTNGTGIGGEGISFTGTSTAPNGVNPFTVIPGAASVTGTVVGSQSVKFYCDNPPIPSQREINVTAASDFKVATCGFGRRFSSVVRRQPQSTCANGITPPPSGGVHVAGQNLVTAAGQQIVLHGVNKMGTEYMCIHGAGIFDPPGSDSPAVVQAIKSWTGINAVRIPLNEDCWLAINGAPAAYSGANYQSAIQNFVNLLVQNNMVVILDLHWVAPGTEQATGQRAMPDQDHSVTFWTQVATMFGSNSSVILDLFNEPYPTQRPDDAAAWTCWKSGGTCSSGPFYQVAGMQELVTTVRAAGAKNVLMLGGIEYANKVTEWMNYEPSDPLNNLAASWHVYGGNGCMDVTCWNQAPAQLATKVPVISGEFSGNTDCAPTSTALVSTFLTWMDGKKLSYLAWDWDATGTSCSLVTDQATGAPTPIFGAFYKAHVAQF